MDDEYDAFGFGFLGAHPFKTGANCQKAQPKSLTVKEIHCEKIKKRLDGTGRLRNKQNSAFLCDAEIDPKV